MEKTPWLSRDDESHSCIFKSICVSVGVLMMAYCHYLLLDQHKVTTNKTSIQDTAPETYTGIVAIPSYSPDIQHFIPEGWKLDRESIADGDLNGDGRTDHAFAIQPYDYTSQNRARPILIVAFAAADNKLKRACVAPHILEQRENLDFHSTIEIKQDNLVILQQGNEAWKGRSGNSNELTFRWEGAHFVLKRSTAESIEFGSVESQDSVQPGMTKIETYDYGTGLLRHRLVVGSNAQTIKEYSETLTDCVVPIKARATSTLTDWRWDDDDGWYWKAPN